MSGITIKAGCAVEVGNKDRWMSGYECTGDYNNKQTWVNFGGRVASADRSAKWSKQPRGIN